MARAHLRTARCPPRADKGESMRASTLAVILIPLLQLYPPRPLEGREPFRDPLARSREGSLRTWRGGRRAGVGKRGDHHTAWMLERASARDRGVGA